MGANIGTTITAQLVSLDLVGLAPVALGVGIVLYLFSSKPKVKNMAEILIGFGILFTGMDFMKAAVKPLTEFEGFTIALSTLGQNPILGILLGFGITAIVQSSSASMGMLLAVSSTGAISLGAALPILYGENIGTCVTSLISSIGASKNARRAATMHLIFNIIGTMVFMLVLTKPITMIVTNLDPNDVSRQIANAHTLFNLLNVIILLPFAKYIVKLALKLIPEKDSENENTSSTKYLDDRILETPSIALGNTIQEVLRMGNKAAASLDSSILGFINKSRADIDSSFEQEKLVNKLQKDILNYLLKLSKSPLNNDERHKADLLFNTVNDIERVGDHAENIAELGRDLIDLNIGLSDNAIEEINNIYFKASHNFKNALIALENTDREVANKVLELEKEVNLLEKAFRKTHLDRLNEGNCTIDSGILYLDLLTNLERISDHSVNIAQQVLRLN